MSDDILTSAEEARLMAEMFQQAQDFAQKGETNADILILMDIDGVMVSFCNTTTAMAVLLAETYSMHAVMGTYNTPEEVEDE